MNPEGGMCSNAAMKRRLPIWQPLVLCLCLLLQSGWATLSSVQMSLMQQRMAYQQQCEHAPATAVSAARGCITRPTAENGDGGHLQHHHAAMAAAMSDATGSTRQHQPNNLSTATDPHSADSQQTHAGMSSDCDCQCDCQKDCLRSWHSAFSPAFLALRPLPVPQLLRPANIGLSPFQPEVALRPPITLT